MEAGASLWPKKVQVMKTSPCKEEWPRVFCFFFFCNSPLLYVVMFIFVNIARLKSVRNVDII